MKDHDIAPRRLRNSGLGAATRRRPEEVVRRHGAMQAQDLGPTRWAIGQRASGSTDDDVAQALASGAIVRTHVLRPTWHLAAREDIRWLLALTGPRVQKQNSSRYRELGLEGTALGRCENVIATALDGENHLTRRQIGGVLDSAGIDRSGQRLPYILMHCELEAVICSGTPEGKDQTYALFDERVPEGGRSDRDESLKELTRRYLASHGPATVRDLRWWSGLTVADIKKALDMLGSDLASETIGDLTFWRLATDRPAAAPRGAHLLHVYDELLVGYSESRYFGDPRAEAALTASRNRALPTGIVLMQGAVFGRWRRTIKPHSVVIEVRAYGDVGPNDDAALQAAAEDLGSFLGRRATLDLTRL